MQEEGKTMTFDQKGVGVFMVGIRKGSREKSMGAAAILRLTKRNNTENNTDS